MKIVSNHAHLMPENSWLPGSADMLLELMDACGIEKTVVFPPFACQFENDRKKANLWALEEVRNHEDRFIPAGTLSPIASDAIELLHLLSSEGVRLFKIHPSIDLQDISDPAAKEFYQEAQSLSVILDYHTGPHFTRLSLVKPEKYDDLVWDYPDLNFIFEHIGGRTYFEEFLAIISNHAPKEDGGAARVYAGLTSILDNQVNKMWYLGPEKVADAINILGADKIIFGLDFPWNDKEQTMSSIKIIKEFQISEKDKAKILGGNLFQILNANQKSHSEDVQL